MSLKRRLLLGIAVGLSIYFAALSFAQVELANEAIEVLRSCESNKLNDCKNLTEHPRLLLRWDDNLRFYSVLSIIFALLVGYFTPKRNNV
ncbi:hypothetical protein [Psychrosphaera haliotis]|uniref:Uncharacterized protein n=1 Tax=Psychrosphaera haliotis TaxID=555083 RepID=A0A6N8F767_9GAMM|nr:hypothetical protein [Psychrosphaera haliotis]MUH72004.1 hypothetical protein [Psychrosphaera haliotis]